MKSLIFYIILLIISFPIYLIAQTNEIDSLEKLLLEHSSDDLVKINLLISTANAFQNINPQKTLAYATEAGRIADSLDYIKGQAEAFDQMASYYSTMSDYNRALEYSNKSLVINRSIANKKGIAKNIRDMAKIHYFQGDVKKAMDYLNQALEINISLKDSTAICYTYAILGTNYNDFGEYALALDYGETALKIAYKINDKMVTSYALNNLAVIYETQENSPKALEYYQKSFLIDERLKDYKGASIVASNIAIVLQKQGDYINALEFCRKGLHYAELIGFKTGLTYNYEYMGQIYKAQGDYDNAQESMQKTLTLQQEIGNIKGVAIGYRDLADLFLLQDKYGGAMDYYRKAFDISESIVYKPIEISSLVGISKTYYKQQLYNKAYKYSRMAYTIAKSISNKRYLKTSSEALAKSSEALGLYKEAYVFQVEFKTLSDSLNSEENVKKLAYLEYEFKYEREKEILQLEQQKKDKLQAAELKKQKIVRNAFIGGFILMILLVIAIYRSFVQKRKVNKTLQIKNKEIEHQAEELQTTNEALVKLSQFKQDMTNMVVHDLKNPLSTILNIEVFSEEYNRMEIIKHAGFKMMNLVQNILDVYKYESVEIELVKEKTDVLELINNAIEEVDFSAKLRDNEFNINMPQRIEVNADAELLRRVFANILSNAIKFSLRNSIISIQCNITENNELKVSIHNNGEHIPIEEMENIFEKYGQVEKRTQGKFNSTGLGLTFCKMVVEAHKGVIDVKSGEKEGTTFWFTLPEAKETKK